MIQRLRNEQSGFTLVELLIAATLMLIVLSATLLSFNNAQNNARGNALQNDQLAALRPQMDRLIGQLRNVANPTTNIASINYVDNYRAVFLTTDPSRRWVSYCLSKTSPESVQNEAIYYQFSASSQIAQQTSSSGCPSTSQLVAGTPDWTTKIKLVSNVTNDITAGSPRPLFQYAGANGAIDASAGLQGSAASAITRVSAAIYLDTNAFAGQTAATDKSPKELSLESGAFLRNMNQAPSAQFLAHRGSGNSFTLDGGDSSDPEGRNLQYYWYETSAAPTSATQRPADPLSQLPDCDNTQTATFGTLVWKCLGTGVILSHDFTGDLPTNVHLMVVDPGNIATLSVQPGMPSSFGACLNTSSTTRLETQCEALP